MPKANQTNTPTEGSRRKLPRTRTAEGKENQMIKLAFDLAAQQLMDGTASSQVITHFLKLGSLKEKLENEKLRADLRVAEAKIKSMESSSDIKILMKEAMDAMKRYNGESVDEDYYDE